MRISAAVACLAGVSLLAGPAWRAALPGYRYEFPRDHFSHSDFQTEWWYFTGNVRTHAGRRFGFELTFFRHGVRPEHRGGGVWDVRDVWLAHFALSDIDGSRFLHTERMTRTGPGLAGADLTKARVWNGNWRVDQATDPNSAGGVAEQRLEAIAETFRIRLTMRPAKPPVIHGSNGVSQKAEGAGRASHYISSTRLSAQGEIGIGGERYSVSGLAWMDHEFFTHQLTPDQTGWDWFSIQFDDGTELMLYRLRRKDGSVDPWSAGTYVDVAGGTRRLERDEFTLTPGATWTSPSTGARYPVEWAIEVAPLGLRAAVSTRLDKQELTSRSRAVSAYWEGTIDVRGTRRGRTVQGSGYLEMTGYAGPVRMGEPNSRTGNE
jgi:predicted secreted hydrolase